MTEPITRRIRPGAGDGSGSEREAVQAEVLEALREHPSFKPVAVEIERLKPSRRPGRDTEGFWVAMDAGLEVLSGTLSIKWTSGKRDCGEMDVHVGASGLW